MRVTCAQCVDVPLRVGMYGCEDMHDYFGRGSLRGNLLRWFLKFQKLRAHKLSIPSQNKGEISFSVQKWEFSLKMRRPSIPISRIFRRPSIPKSGCGAVFSCALAFPDSCALAILKRIS